MELGALFGASEASKMARERSRLEGQSRLNTQNIMRDLMLGPDGAGGGSPSCDGSPSCREDFVPSYELKSEETPSEETPRVNFDNW
jgi:hypothetical protein